LIGATTFEFLLHAPAPWQSADGGWRTASTPGVRVWSAGLDTDTTASMTEGVARIPDLATASADYAALHTLSLKRRRGDFTTVIVPFENGPEAWFLAQTTDGLLLTHPRGSDLLSSSCLTRKDLAGVVEWSAAWRSTELRWASTAWLRASAPVDLHLRVEGAAWSVTAATGARCHLTFAERPTSLALDGVGVGRPTVTLPYAGTWRIDGTGVRDLLDQVR
jgi:hypothetical protein